MRDEEKYGCLDEETRPAKPPPEIPSDPATAAEKGWFGRTMDTLDAKVRGDQAADGVSSTSCPYSVFRQQS